MSIPACTLPTPILVDPLVLCFFVLGGLWDVLIFSVSFSFHTGWSDEREPSKHGVTGIV